MNKRGQTVNRPWTTENNGEQMCSFFCKTWTELLSFLQKRELICYPFCKRREQPSSRFLEKMITNLFLILENENIFVLDFRFPKPATIPRKPQKLRCSPHFFPSNIVRLILFWSCFVCVFSNIVRTIFECLEKKNARAIFFITRTCCCYTAINFCLTVSCK